MKRVLLIQSHTSFAETKADLLRMRGYDVTVNPEPLQGSNGQNFDAVVYAFLFPADGELEDYATGTIERMRRQYPHARIIIESTRPFLDGHMDEIKRADAVPREVPNMLEELATVIG